MEEKKEGVVKEKKDRVRLIVHILMVIGMYIAIAALINTTITIYKYRDMLTNPIGYSMDKFGLNYCTCYDAQKRIVPIKGLSYDDSYDVLIPKPEYNHTNYSQLLDNFKVIGAKNGTG